MNDLPLSGLRVVDLTRLLPGPYCSLMLADLGASVVKVEEPRGDYLRYWPPYWPHGDTPMAAAFAALNRNKRSLSVDLKAPGGVAALLAVLKGADVLLEGFRPGVLAKLGLTRAVLSELNPRLVVCSISGYGQSGPLAQRAGHDLNYVARSGLLAHNAKVGEAPHPLSVQLADLAGGALFPATAILAALYARERTGRGAFIDAAMSDACVALMPFFSAAEVATGASDAPGTGLLHGGVPAYSVYPTRDGRYLAVAALEPKFWASLCEALDREDLKASGLLSGEEGAQVWRTLSAIFATDSLAGWTEFFADKDCCVEPVLSVAEAMSDAHHTSRGLFTEVQQHGQPMTQVQTPIWFAGVRRGEHAPAQAVGAASREVLLEAGLPADEVDALIAAGVVVQG